MFLLRASLSETSGKVAYDEDKMHKDKKCDTYV